MKQTDLLKKTYRITSLLLVFLVAFLASVIFLNPSSVGNENFLWFFNLWASVWALLFTIVLILTFVLARNLIKLFFEYQTSQSRRRIKEKLVLTFIIFSLFPALIMFFVAFGLINENLTDWLRAPSEQLLDSSAVIVREFYREKQQAISLKAEELARELALLTEPQRENLQQFAPQWGFESLQILDLSRHLVFEGSGGWDQIEAAAESVLQGQVYYQLEQSVTENSQLVDRGIVGVPLLDSSGSVTGALFARFTINPSVAFHALSIAEANQAYQGIKETLGSLRMNYFSILGLTTLAVVFGFVWLGSYIARRLTVPLEALAEASHELAEGNLDHRVEVQAADELGVLVSSFNRMAQQLKESRQALERTNEELRSTNVRLDERRKYIETVLQNIATGVLTVDESEVIRTVNEAALKMLQTTQHQIVGQSLRKVTDSELYQEFQTMKKRAPLHGTYRRQISFKSGEQRRVVAATMTCNPLSLQEEVEYLIVLDDLTELIRAEKFSAWQEVARRLAHEIKNPLTPIQLSAERVNKRFKALSQSLEHSKQVAQFGEVLEEATGMIIAEAEMLKDLVAEFSRFARLPICRPVPTHLHQLINQTLSLYDGSLEAVEIEKDLDHRIQKVRVDPEQLKRVFSNLLDNSLDALAEVNGDRRILIQTSFNSGRNSISIEFQDSGVGIDPSDYEHLFLPYFSTKKKGTGLGLAIVRQIISEHNGLIRAEPNVPQGARFIMELPLA